MFQNNNGNDDSFESDKNQDDGNSGGGISAYRQGEKWPEGQQLYQFGNGWNKEGHDCFYNLMSDINKSRAHFNQSFDKQMKIYVKCMRNKERNRLAQKQAVQVAALPNDMMLLTVGDILQNHAEASVLQLNEELMEHIDE